MNEIHTQCQIIYCKLTNDEKTIIAKSISYQDKMGSGVNLVPLDRSKTTKPKQSMPKSPPV